MPADSVSVSEQPRAAALQDEYRKLSDNVRAAYRRHGARADVSGLQARETEIVRELRTLGARPLPSVAQ